jgi:hypothetical protein
MKNKINVCALPPKKGPAIAAVLARTPFDIIACPEKKEVVVYPHISLRRGGTTMFARLYVAGAEGQHYRLTNYDKKEVSGRDSGPYIFPLFERLGLVYFPREAGREKPEAWLNVTIPLGGKHTTMHLQLENILSEDLFKFV